MATLELPADPLAESRGDLASCAMASTLALDPSRPYQVGEGLLALWLPRGRGGDDLAQGLLATVDVCDNPSCSCTLATLRARRIDDSAVRAEYDGDTLRVISRATPSAHAPPQDAAVLEVDIATGVVVERGGGKPREAVARFFEEPLPFWVLDALWARWRAPRLPLAIDWRTQALEHWEPGVLLSTMIAFPEERPDLYVVDGRLFQVDTLFCTTPACECTQARLSVLALSEDRRRAEEVGGAWLPPETMVPVGFEGDGLRACEETFTSSDYLVRGGRSPSPRPRSKFAGFTPPPRLAEDGEARFELVISSQALSHETFSRLFNEWRRRNAPAGVRLLELRDLTRQRGRELHRLAQARARPAARPRPATPARPATPVSPTPRNAPCPCGSGLKHKRCCGK